jgi:hypothetical protein
MIKDEANDCKNNLKEIMCRKGTNRWMDFCFPSRDKNSFLSRAAP